MKSFTIQLFKLSFFADEPFNLIMIKSMIERSKLFDELSWYKHFKDNKKHDVLISFIYVAFFCCIYIILMKSTLKFVE